MSDWRSQPCRPHPTVDGGAKDVEKFRGRRPQTMFAAVAVAVPKSQTQSRSGHRQTVRTEMNSTQGKCSWPGRAGSGLSAGPLDFTSAPSIKEWPDLARTAATQAASAVALGISSGSYVNRAVWAATGWCKF